jgi:hypothetical protein
MELALLRAGHRAALTRAELLGEYPPVLTHAFDAATKMMATVHRGVASAISLQSKEHPKRFWRTPARS